MIFWIDAQLSPAIASWITLTFAVTAVPLRDIGLREATDHEIFLAARSNQAIVVTKDRDFVQLLRKLGPPPQVVWITCGNTAYASLRQTLTSRMPLALQLLKSGQELVEIS